MISIIICSRDTNLLTSVSQSVQETIGVPYEIISIDNSKGEFSIFQAYNLGAEKSKFSYLCFMHEDLLFHTPEWGQAVVKHLNDVTIGLIGVVGSVYKSKINSGWWGAPGVPLNILRYHYIQGSLLDKKSEYHLINPQKEVVSDVVTLDGMWLCTRKETWLHNKFDEQRLQGFHFYDLDFSLQIKQSLRVCVIYDVLIEHMSYGSINKSWIESSFVFHEKWADILPLSTIHIPPKQLQMFEIHMAVDFLKKLKELNFNKITYLRFYMKYLNIYSFRDYLYYLKKAVTSSLAFKRN